VTKDSKVILANRVRQASKGLKAMWDLLDNLVKQAR